jgi:hypothetical protein
MLIQHECVETSLPDCRHGRTIPRDSPEQTFIVSESSGFPFHQAARDIHAIWIPNSNSISSPNANVSMNRDQNGLYNVFLVRGVHEIISDVRSR